MGDSPVQSLGFIVRRVCDQAAIPGVRRQAAQRHNILFSGDVRTEYTHIRMHAPALPID